ncbi:MAG: hypothetical protein IKN72_07920 [Clostridia bacterium]|nr:hypothetical protein [Clostridia bacterium]
MRGPDTLFYNKTPKSSTVLQKYFLVFFGTGDAGGKRKFCLQFSERCGMMKLPNKNGRVSSATTIEKSLLLRYKLYRFGPLFYKSASLTTLNLAGLYLSFGLLWSSCLATCGTLLLMRPSWAHFLLRRKNFFGGQKHETNKTTFRGPGGCGDAAGCCAGDECRHDGERGERRQSKTGCLYAKLSIRQQMDGQLCRREPMFWLWKDGNL